MRESWAKYQEERKAAKAADVCPNPRWIPERVYHAFRYIALLVYTLFLIITSVFMVVFAAIGLVFVAFFMHITPGTNISGLTKLGIFRSTIIIPWLVDVGPVLLVIFVAWVIIKTVTTSASIKMPTFSTFLPSHIPDPKRPVEHVVKCFYFILVVIVTYGTVLWSLWWLGVIPAIMPDIILLIMTVFFVLFSLYAYVDISHPSRKRQVKQNEQAK